jgi:GNAT superfamily N-acetyltransferase
LEIAVIRPAITADIEALKLVIDATDMFPSEMLDDMIAPYFANPAGGEFWLTDDDDEKRGGPVGIAYCAPERMTEGTWNLLLIAQHPTHQGQGRGTAILRYVEQMLASRGDRVLLVETSGLPAFERTRAFYLKNGYDKEARIRDFYKAGEDKIVFRKALNAEQA